jgi:uncharacterized protein DUF4919
VAGAADRGHNDAILQSPLFARGGEVSSRVRDLRQEMFAAMEANDVPGVREKARQTLELLYIDLEAQKARYQSCAALHDEACAERGKRIEMGLLKSVVSTGNGHSCATAWKVVTIDEEYFVLRMLEMELRRQSLVDRGGHVCDEMAVTDPKGKRRTYYFDVGAMLAAQERLMEARQAQKK